MNSEQTLLDHARHKLQEDFYKLHFSNKNNNKHSRRSNSVITVIHKPSQMPKDSISCYSTKKSSPKKQYRSQELGAPNLQNKKTIPQFRAILGAKNYGKKLSSIEMPLHNHKQLQQLAKNNYSVKRVYIKTKQENTKLDNVVLSSKYSEEAKLTYLASKNREIEEAINRQTEALYEQFFMEDYQNKFGRLSQQKFLESMQGVLAELAQRVRLS